MRTENNTLMLADSKGVSIVDINSIIRVEAINNYSKLYFTNGKQLVVSKVLKKMEAMLAGKGFERVHRSHLVNTAFIFRYNLGKQRVTLNNDEEICISRRKRTEMRRRVNEQTRAYLVQLRQAVPA